MTEPSMSKLLEFAVGNKDIEKINSHLNRFNPIDVMGMADMEIRHSKILGWLLNPRENHGLADGFLVKFVQTALLLGGDSKSENDSKTIYEKTSNLQHCNVYVEWNNIDIFIECPANKMVIIIENKWHSTQGEDQLKTYWESVKKRYEDYTQYGIFLTLFDEAPNCDEYKTINYGDIAEMLNGMLDLNRDSMAPQIYNFIKNYLDVIERKCGMSETETEMKNLARTIYRENANVIDYLYEQGKTTEFNYAVTEFLSKKSVGNAQFKESKPKFQFNVCETGYLYFAMDKTHFSFLPMGWVEALGELYYDERDNDYQWGECEKYYWKYPIICWAQLEGNRLRLVLEVGPCLPKDREILLEKLAEIESVDDRRNKNKNKRTKVYIKYYEGVDIQDSDELVKVLGNMFSDFKTIVENVTPALQNFMQERK